MRVKMPGNYGKIRLTVEKGIDTLDQYEGCADTVGGMGHARLPSDVFFAVVDKKIQGNIAGGVSAESPFPQGTATL